MEVAALILVCTTMFLGSYAAGCLPLFFNLSEKKIRLASIFGAGLLVGTALCVIIPEGISTLYEYSIPAINEHFHSSSPLNQQKVQPDLKVVMMQNKEVGQLPSVSQENRVEEKAEPVKDTKHVVKREFDQVTTQKQNLPQKIQPNFEMPNFNGPIGISLTTGFLFMFVIDQFSKSSQAGGRNKGVPTLGLVIHAAADGIAMGSTSTSTEAEMQMIVFLAIMLHKGPTAFALVSFLVMEGLEKSRARRHLLFFSLAAPAGTIITYILLHTIETTYFSSPYVTGLILLFSAGTFLYIAAAHVLPELVETKCSLSAGQSRAHFSIPEVLLFLLSAVLPSFISSHGHAH